MKIKYIYHSGFSVELEKSFLIFDYYKGDIPPVPKGKAVYFFASHKHQDHFNMNILNMLADYNPTYILSNDIRLSEKYLTRYGYDINIKSQIISAKKNDYLEVDNLHIRTLKSTDCGCAFLVKTEGINIYHAGDLNIWSWPGDDDVHMKYQQTVYFEQIDKLKDTTVDIAFVPLDPRLKEYYYMGAMEFLKRVEVKKLFPMHMWDQYECINDFLNMDEVRKYKDIIVRINRDGEEWKL